MVEFLIEYGVNIMSYFLDKLIEDTIETIEYKEVQIILESDDEIEEVEGLDYNVVGFHHTD